MIGRASKTWMQPWTMLAIVFVAFSFVAALSCSLPRFAFAEEESPSDSDGSSDPVASVTSVDADESNIVDPTQRADNSFIYDTSIEDILSETSLHEGHVVQFVGEAVGDGIVADAAGRYCWVAVESMVEGSDASISVYMTVEQAAQIDSFGRYGVTGTTLQVRGTFNQACSVHDGLVDVHATNVGVVSRGVEHPDEFEPRRFGLGVLLVLAGALLIAGFSFARERLR